MEMMDMSNILTEDEAETLFTDVADDENEQLEETPPALTQEQQNNQTTTEGNPEDLFGDEDDSESVSSEDNNKKDKEDTSKSTKDEGSSPDNANFYSSITEALVDEGVFPDLTEEEVSKVTEPEHFVLLMQDLIKKGLDDALRRIYEALNAGVEPDAIKLYEGTLNYLDSINDDLINDEGQQGLQTRRKLILLDLINRGIKLERAVKMTDRLFLSGEDVEEAKQALQSNKEFFLGKYKELLDNAKAEEQAEKRRTQQLAELLKKDILSDNKIFGDIDVDKKTRQRVYDNVARPVYKDPDTGRFYTAVQKYRMEHENDYIRNVGYIFTVTDGFKDWSRFTQPVALKTVRKKLRELEHTLNNTSRSSGGKLNYVGNPRSLSLFDAGYTIDIN